jgi:hypothetical protein
MNFRQRLQEAYQAGYESALNEQDVYKRPARVSALGGQKFHAIVDSKGVIVAAGLTEKEARKKKKFGQKVMELPGAKVGQVIKKEAYEAGYESELNEGVLSSILRLARLLRMTDNVPLGGAKGAVRRKLARPRFDPTSTGDVLVPGPEFPKIGDPDIVAPTAKSIDDLVDDPAYDIKRRPGRKKRTEKQQEILDKIKKALDDLDEPIG